MCIHVSAGMNFSLSSIAGLTGLMHLDLFGARITDSGTSYLRGMRTYDNHPMVVKSTV